MALNSPRKLGLTGGAVVLHFVHLLKMFFFFRFSYFSSGCQGRFSDIFWIHYLR